MDRVRLDLDHIDHEVAAVGCQMDGLSVLHALHPVDQVCARVEIIGCQSLTFQCAGWHLHPFDALACAAVRNCTHNRLPLCRPILHQGSPSANALGRGALSDAASAMHCRCNGGPMRPRVGVSRTTVPRMQPHRPADRAPACAARLRRILYWAERGHACRGCLANSTVVFSPRDAPGGPSISPQSGSSERSCARYIFFLETYTRATEVVMKLSSCFAVGFLIGALGCI